MAAYREHISVSGLCGVAYGVTAVYLMDFTPTQGILAGVLTWIAGMLPDLDSDTGKPIREVFSLLAASAPFVMMHHLLEWGRNDPEKVMLFAVLMYAGIRYGLASFLSKISVHRGMFHSVPALFIAAELTFLAYKSDSIMVRTLMAGGVGIGFFSHLLLDEIYSVQWNGIRIRLNKAAGSAIKLIGKNFAANALTYGLLFFLTYLSLMKIGLIEPPEINNIKIPVQQAIESVPERH
ncbi:hypothetical protein MNBD_PLANCTO02-2803 [hydrothermal vent metagenome]|uniref:Metal-dependent hydrolase n=1 Tax=hydrothermal vent metagenome TaxID=652676 RepID=A0A3B1DZI5_9ZZZZ